MVHLHDQAAVLPKDRCRLCNQADVLFLSASTCFQQNILPHIEDTLRGSMSDLSPGAFAVCSYSYTWHARFRLTRQAVTLLGDRSDNPSCVHCRYDPNGSPPRGEICIRGPLLFKEYYKDPKKTEEAMGKSPTCNTVPLTGLHQSSSIHLSICAIMNTLSHEKVEPSTVIARRHTSSPT